MLRTVVRLELSLSFFCHRSHWIDTYNRITHQTILHPTPSSSLFPPRRCHLIQNYRFLRHFFFRFFVFETAPLPRCWFLFWFLHYLLFFYLLEYSCLSLLCECRLGCSPSLYPPIFSVPFPVAQRQHGLTSFQPFQLLHQLLLRGFLFLFVFLLFFSKVLARFKQRFFLPESKRRQLSTHSS